MEFLKREDQPMQNDVVLNKIQTIERCIGRIRDEYEGSENSFRDNYTKQDSIVLNLERASQASIDISANIIKNNNLKLPNSSREMFEILEENHIISKYISRQMQSMVGFRNIAVHDYQNLNIDIVISIVENNLKDFERFIGELFENYLKN